MKSSALLFAAVHGLELLELKSCEQGECRVLDHKILRGFVQKIYTSTDIQTIENHPRLNLER